MLTISLPVLDLISCFVLWRTGLNSWKFIFVEFHDTLEEGCCIAAVPGLPPVNHFVMCVQTNDVVVQCSF